MFQKFEQTIVCSNFWNIKCCPTCKARVYGKFNIRYNGPTLWNETDERFKILTPYSFKRELSLHFINLY